jgi:hypothetical protein
MLPGLGDLHPAKTDEDEQLEELPSDSGHEQVAVKWAQTVVALAPLDEGALLTHICSCIILPDHAV